MRIILDGSVRTVKRLRVSLGTLVAIEATADDNVAVGHIALADDNVTAGEIPPADDNVAVGGIALAGATAHRQNRANHARRRATPAFTAAPDVIPTTPAFTAATEVIPTALAEAATAEVIPTAPTFTAATEVIPTPPAFTATTEVLPTALAEAAAAEVIPTEILTAEAAIERAFEAIEQVNRLMHPRAEGSDLARINSAPLNVPTKIHASIGQLLKLAKRIHTLTEGVFDPCTPAQPGRLGDVEVSDDETEVVCHAPVSLDFGGFAKGYAVDCAIEALVAGGCTAGLVNAGGDMRVFGQRDEPVFVRGPAGELTAIELIDAALAVSDTMSGQRPPEHQGYYVRGAAPTPAADQHAGSGEPTAASNAVPPPTAATYAAVIADKVVIADALAKCVLLCAPAVTAHALRVFGATQLRSPVDIAATLTNTSTTR